MLAKGQCSGLVDSLDHKLRCLIPTGTGLCPAAGHINFPWYCLLWHWLLPRKHWFHPGMTEILFMGMLIHKTDKNLKRKA